MVPDDARVGNELQARPMYVWQSGLRRQEQSGRLRLKKRINYQTNLL